MDEIDPKAVVQTGPGLPSWAWHSYQLTWNGPVEKTQTISLWLSHPGPRRSWSFCSSPSLPPCWPRVRARAQLATAGAAGRGPRQSRCAPPVPPFRRRCRGRRERAPGGFPDPALLEELKGRLAPLKPECRPNCATLLACASKCRRRIAPAPGSACGRADRSVARRRPQWTPARRF